MDDTSEMFARGVNTNQMPQAKTRTKMSSRTPSLPPKYAARGKRAAAVRPNVSLGILPASLHILKNSEQQSQAMAATSRAVGMRPRKKHPMTTMA